MKPKKTATTLRTANCWPNELAYEYAIKDWRPNEPHVQDIIRKVYMTVNMIF